MLRRALSILLFAAGCSTEPSTPSPDAEPLVHDDAASLTPDAAEAPDAGSPDTGPSCDDPRATPSMPCGALSWAASDVRSRRRNHHSVALAHTPAGPFLFALGGANGNSVLVNVDAAPIQADGSLGAWVGVRSLPRGTGGGTIGVVSNVIVIAGGMTNGGVTDLSYSTVVQDDGSLGPWTSAGSTHHRRMHPGGFVRGDRIYVLGGFDDPDVWNDVVSATVAADGSVGPWTPAGTLPGPRSHFSVSLIDGYVYLAGGLSRSAFTNPPFLDEVARAEIGSDGALTNWTAMPPLPLALATHASFFYGGHLYVAGGLNDNGHERRVWRAPIQADHSLGD